MTEASSQAVIEATKAAIMIVREAEILISNARTLQATSQMGSPPLKQQMFDWKAPDKYNELCNFKIEVKHFSDEQLQYRRK